MALTSHQYLSRIFTLRGYLASTLSGAMLSDPEQEVTTIQASRWMKTVIQQRWLLTSEAWEERNMVLHKGTNTSITKSDYDEKIKRLYKQQHTINKRDSHLFSLPELLTARLRTKTQIFRTSSISFRRVGASGQTRSTESTPILQYNSKAFGRQTSKTYSVAANPAHNFLHPLSNKAGV